MEIGCLKQLKPPSRNTTKPTDKNRSSSNESTDSWKSRRDENRCPNSQNDGDKFMESTGWSKKMAVAKEPDI
ncbi:hypothetical protein SAY86_024071 [Trapa natans]|uniref:Uncharacterized protein n=1 Tax=Trapa natans TaxID=22666 RepID=A0AAN7RAV2_TRANT|nr:hypothetical protein SAY86_024071 [Trapa natans]